jgi:formamidopyrimidine-DNA glycosylase
VPELPEAETIVRTLAPRIESRRIVKVRYLATRVHGGFPARIEGRVVRKVRRFGKQILLELDAGVLVIRLGMTGLLLHNSAPGPYTRAVLVLDEGMLSFDDIRQFGSMRWQASMPDRLGPDPLEISPEVLYSLLQAHRRQIKPLLLDQGFLRGLGNIYADEALFRAGVHPRACSSRLSKARAYRLYGAIVDVLTKAIERRGSSISDYVDANGQPGDFQLFHQVYGRQGQPCPKCSTPIRRIVVAQRGTHYCPKCQRS